MNIKIAIASDHAGFKIKETVRLYLQGKGYEINDLGTFSEESTDYPDFAHLLAKAVEQQQFDLGILVCGSGNGVNMTANKYPGIRSALCWIPEIAKLARLHNNANVLAMPGRFVDEKTAKQITDAFLETEFEGGRHQRRVDKIACK